MKLTLIAGGGFRSPVIYRAIEAGKVTARYDEIALNDIALARLDRIDETAARVQGETALASTRLVASKWWRLELRAGERSSGDMPALTNPVYVADFSRRN